MDPSLQVHLAEPFEAASVGDVDQVSYLDGIPGEERQRLEQAPPPGVFAGERLDQAGEFRKEEVDERSRDQLGDPSSSALLEKSALHYRPAVVALDVLDPLLCDERANRSVDHPRMPVADVGVGPDHDVAARLVEALPQRLALAGEAAVSRQHLLVDHDARALGPGDFAGSIGRVRVDDEQLVDEGVTLDELAPGPFDDDPDRFLFVQGRQDQADGQSLLVLQVDQARQVPKLAVVEVRLAEPALHSQRDRPRLIGGALGRGKSLGPCLQPLEGGLADRLACLDHDHRLAGPHRDGLRKRPEEERLAGARRRHGRGAHHHDVGVLGLSQDGVANVDRLAHGLLDLAVGVLADEMRQGSLRLGPYALAETARHKMHGRDRRVVAVSQGIGEMEGKRGVGAAADRHQDAVNFRRAALLDDGDVAGRVSDDLVDGRREDRCRRARPRGRRLSAPAEDDQVHVQLRGRLDDPLRGAASDADDGMDRHALRGVVEDALQQPAGLAGPGRALAQRRALRHLHDPQDGQGAGAPVHQRGADSDQLLGRQRIGDGDQDPRRQRRAGHRSGSGPWADPLRCGAFAAACCQRSTRYGLRSSNSRACRSTCSSACSSERCRFSMTRLPTRPK